MRNKQGGRHLPGTQEPLAQNEKSSPEGSLLNARSIGLVLARMTIARIQLTAAVLVVTMIAVALDLNEREDAHASHEKRKKCNHPSEKAHGVNPFLLSVHAQCRREARYQLTK